MFFQLLNSRSSPNTKGLWSSASVASEKVSDYFIHGCGKAFAKITQPLWFAGGAKGPGIFFIIPCIDSYQKVDLRTVSFDVPPQEVRDPCQKRRRLGCVIPHSLLLQATGSGSPNLAFASSDMSVVFYSFDTFAIFLKAFTLKLTELFTWLSVSSLRCRKDVDMDIQSGAWILGYGFGEFHVTISQRTCF